MMLGILCPTCRSPLESEAISRRSRQVGYCPRCNAVVEDPQPPAEPDHERRDLA